MNTRQSVLLAINAFSLHFITLGLMVGAATAGSDPILKSTVLTVILALSSLAAIVFNRIYSAKTLPKTFLFLSLTVSLSLTTALATFSIAWFIMLFISVALSTYLNSVITAEYPIFFNDKGFASRNLQAINISAMALAMTAGPLVISNCGIPILLGISALLMLVSIALTNSVNVPKPLPGEGLVLNNELPSLNFLVWLGLGLFNIVEVPMLVDRFSSGNGLISTVFIITLIANLLTAQFVAARLKQSDHLLLYASAALLLVSSSIYLLATNLASVFLTVFLFGALNAVYNVIQYKMIFLQTDINRRTALILTIRLSSQFGILGAAGLVGLAQFFSAPLYSSLALICFLLTLVIVLKGSVRKILVCLTAVAGLLTAGVSQTSHADTKKNFKIGVYSLPSELDPALTLDISTALINRQVFPFLYRFETNKLVPELAEGHSISPDGLTYRIKIRTGFKFADGSEVKASDVLSSLNYVLKVNGESMRWALGLIDGYAESIDSIKTTFRPLRGISIPEDGIVQIRLTNPSRDLLQILASLYFAISKADKSSGKFNTISDQFKIKRHGESSITLIPTPANPLAQKNIIITFSKVSSPFVAIETLKRGELDWIFTVEPSNSVPDYQTIAADPLNVIVLQLNMQDLAFKSQKDRCAFTQRFSAAVNNLPNIGRKINLGLPFTARIFPAQKDLGNRVIPERKVELTYIDSVASFSPEDLDSISRAFLNSGFVLTIRKSPLRPFLSNAKKGKFQAALWGFGPDYFSPDALLNPLLGSKQQYNYSKFSNSSFDAKLIEARSAEQDSERVKLYDDTFRTIHEDCPIAFLGVQKQHMILRNGYELPQPSSLGVHTTVLKDQLRINQ